VFFVSFDDAFLIEMKDRANEIYKRGEDQKGTAYDPFNIWMHLGLSFPMCMSFPEIVDFN
jgi:hypothetical protein